MLSIVRSPPLSSEAKFQFLLFFEKYMGYDYFIIVLFDSQDYNFSISQFSTFLYTLNMHYSNQHFKEYFLSNKKLPFN